MRCYSQRSILASTCIGNISGKMYETANSIKFEGEKFTTDFTAVCTTYIFRSLEFFLITQMSG